MAVMLETSRGDLVVDLFTEDCPITTKNFLKLCKIKYYNNVLFHNVQSNFIVQTGDPTGTGRGGESIYGLMHGQGRFFEDELREHLKHKTKGTVAMASGANGSNASQFYITTGQELDSLDGKHTVFGEVSEGLNVLQQIDEAFVDGAGRPLQNIRIRHTHVLDDPFDDPAELASLIPEASPPPTFEQGDRLEDDWKPSEDTRAPEVIEEEIRKSEAQNRAVVLEMIGDLPEADSKPPSNMLFIAKLNQVTTEEDLETIFGRFGNITSCDIIRDKKTGDSLCYAFLGYDTDEACENAYFKMNNVLIDDRRIKVDFSQSVYHLWKQFRRFGREGGAPDPMQQASAQPGAIGGHDRLQLKTAGGSQRGQSNQQYSLLLDQDQDTPERQLKGRPSGKHSHSARQQSHKSGPASDLPLQARPNIDQPSGHRHADRHGSSNKQLSSKHSRRDVSPNGDRHQPEGYKDDNRKRSRDDLYHEEVVRDKIHRHGEQADRDESMKDRSRREADSRHGRDDRYQPRDIDRGDDKRGVRGHSKSERHSHKNSEGRREGSQSRKNSHKELQNKH